MKKYLSRITALLFIFLSFQSFAQKRDVSYEASEADILQELESLKKIGIKKFVDKMESISNKTAAYIKIREQRCSGDFTSFIMDGNGNKKFQTNKLTKSEKRLCQYNLINFQINIMKVAHQARRRYLLNSHQSQLKELDQINHEQIFALEKEAKDYKK